MDLLKRYSFFVYMAGGFGAAVIFYLIFHDFSPLFPSSSEKEKAYLIEKGEKNYAAGEEAKTIEEREKWRLILL